MARMPGDLAEHPPAFGAFASRASNRAPPSRFARAGPSIARTSESGTQKRSTPSGHDRSKPAPAFADECPRARLFDHRRCRERHGHSRRRRGEARTEAQDAAEKGRGPQRGGRVSAGPVAIKPNAQNPKLQKSSKLKAPNSKLWARRLNCGKGA